jgi:hypothetical protein|tara:strand:- start:146 stop:505 length:360 start_codon:yes stop_codon:yes gene_type:complete
MEFDTDLLDEYCQNTFGHSNWEFVETKPDHLVVKFNKEPLKEDVQKDPSFPWWDMWGSMTVDEDFEGMHPDKLIDFHIYREEDDTKHIVFYGWDKKYQQTDTQNVIGHYQLINMESEDE